MTDEREGECLGTVEMDLDDVHIMLFVIDSIRSHKDCQSILGLRDDELAGFLRNALKTSETLNFMHSILCPNAGNEVVEKSGLS